MDSGPVGVLMVRAPADTTRRTKPSDPCCHRTPASPSRSPTCEPSADSSPSAACHADAAPHGSRQQRGSMGELVGLGVAIDGPVALTHHLRQHTRCQRESKGRCPPWLSRLQQLAQLIRLTHARLRVGGYGRVESSSLAQTCFGCMSAALQPVGRRTPYSSWPKSVSGVLGQSVQRGTSAMLAVVPDWGEMYCN